MSIIDAFRTLGFGIKFKSILAKKDTYEAQSNPSVSNSVSISAHPLEPVSNIQTMHLDREIPMNQLETCQLRLTSVSTSKAEGEYAASLKTDKRKLTQGSKGDQKKAKHEERDAMNQEVRHRHKIFVWGTDIASHSETFEGIFKRCKTDTKVTLLRNIDKLGFVRPTPIQMQAVPQMLQRREILACAPTGSGKTLAFALPLLCHIRKDQPTTDKIKALILEPTRELMHQTYHVMRRLCEDTHIRVHQIRNLKTSKERLKAEGTKHDIVVSTPKRIVALVRRKEIDLSAVEWLIVDESDKLFESGPGNMRDQLAFVYKACDNVNLKHAFFSATFSFEVEEWCKLNLNSVITVCVGKRNSTVDTVEQELKFVGDEYERAEQLYNELMAESFRVDLMHSGRSQEERNAAITKFRTGETFVLICTELLGRGIDFKGVNVVINYDFPQSPISYIHRIGRTGRAGRKGCAITLFTEDDKILLRSIANVMKTAGCAVPEYMLNVPKPDKKLKRRLTTTAINRKPINLTTKDKLWNKRTFKRLKRSARQPVAEVEAQAHLIGNQMCCTNKK